MADEIILFFIGIVVGGMNAIAGGGMLVGFPVMLAVGMPALAANATANLTILPGSLSSAYGYRRYLRKVPRLYLWLLLPCIAGAALGASILKQTSFDNFQTLVPWLILFAVLLFAYQPLLHYHLHKYMHSHPSKRKNHTFLIITLAIFPLAIYGGYFGAGFGFIMLAFLGFTSLHDIHKMNAIKNLASATIALVSIVFLLDSNLIDWRKGLITAAGAAIGGYYGSIGAQKISTHAIRVIVILIGLTTTAYLGLRSY